MKKLLLCFSIASAYSLFSQNPIPNGDFENWNTLANWQPQNYETGNRWALESQLPLVAERVTDAYHGNYAIKLTTRANTSDTLTAWVANGDPGDPIGQGIPYTETPAALRGYYQCAIPAGDSANIFLIFKKTGQASQTYLFKLGGTQTAYTLFEFPVTGLSFTPDSIIFGAVPSNALAGNFPGIPGSMLQLDSISFTGVTAQPAMFNGDFENWVNSPVITLPYWDVESENLIQTPDAFSGNYALELQTLTMHSGNTYSGMATNGQSVQSGTIGGHPFSNQIDTLVFEYKYFPGDPSDSAKVELHFKAGGANLSLINNYLPATTGAYEHVEIPFNLGSAPDTFFISLRSSKGGTLSASYSGAVFKIDDIHMKSLTAPTANFGAPDTVCEGEQFVLTDSSTNGPSAWDWDLAGAAPDSSADQNPAVHYDNPGTYTVTLTSSNISGTSAPVSKTIVVLPAPLLSTTILPSTNVCEGTMAVFSSLGAATILWTGGIINNQSFPASVTQTGSYTVIGTDNNGCSDSSTINFNVNPLPQVGFIQSSDSVCEGLPVLLYGTGAASYVWNNGVTDSVAFIPADTASYIVTGTDTNSCSNTDTAMFTVLSLPNVGYSISTDTVVCQEDSVMLIGTGADSYSWNMGVTDGVLFSPVTGTYIVTGTDVNGCMNMDTVSLTVNTCLGMHETEISKVSVFPNPFTSEAVIQFNAVQKNSVMTVYDIAGRVIKTIPVSAGTSTVYCSREGLENGVYIFKLSEGNRLLAQGKFAVQ